MRPALRKFVLTAHIIFSIGWIGAAVAYLALGLSAVTTRDAQTVRSAWIGMELIGWYVIVPLALTAVLTGVVIALGTPWGLFRHYWTLITLVLTTLSTLILLLHMPTVSFLAAIAREANGAELGSLGGDLVHTGLALAVLIVITAVNVYKPRGLTPYGWRRQHEGRIQQADCAAEEGVAR